MRIETIEKCLANMDKKTMRQAQELMDFFGIDSSNSEEMEHYEIESEKNQMTLLDFISEVIS